MENHRGNLEKEKLNLEINELKKAWYKKASYQKIILSTLIASGTFFLTIRSGIVETERKKLESEKDSLRTEISNLKIEKQLFQDTIQIFKRKEIEYITNYKKDQQKEMLYIQELRNKNKKDEIIKYYKNKLDSFTGIKIFNETFDETFN